MSKSKIAELLETVSFNEDGPIGCHELNYLLHGWEIATDMPVITNLFNEDGSFARDPKFYELVFIKGMFMDEFTIEELMEGYDPDSVPEAEEVA